MRDILLDGIVEEINNCLKPHKANDEVRENGNLVNDNIVFYVCGSLVNKRRGGCPECFATLNGSCTPPPEMSVQYLEERKNVGALAVCSKKLYVLALKMETAFLRTVSDHTIFNRDSYEAIYHDVLLNKLHTT